MPTWWGFASAAAASIPLGDAVPADLCVAPMAVGDVRVIVAIAHCHVVMADDFESAEKKNPSDHWHNHE
jgi:hypothetical protein